ncbi:MAG: hypothetical protein R3B45_00335 [Bdellovibrionota bacterium]
MKFHIHIVIISIYVSLNSCGQDKDDNDNETLAKKFEAIYGYTSCEGAIITTTLTNQQTWTTIFQTYNNNSFEFAQSIYNDSNCKNRIQYMSRSGLYNILSTSNEDTGIINLEITTSDYEFFIVNDSSSDISCDRSNVEDNANENCDKYLDVTRYVSAKLTDDGLLPPADFEAGGTTEDDISTELDTQVLKVLNEL